MRSEFEMSSSEHRVMFLFAMSNLTRWITLVNQQLPNLVNRMLLLRPCKRNEHVTITLQSGGKWGLMSHNRYFTLLGSSSALLKSVSLAYVFSHIVGLFLTLQGLQAYQSSEHSAYGCLSKGVSLQALLMLQDARILLYHLLCSIGIAREFDWLRLDQIQRSY